jgi:hypothetical protein
MSVLIIIIFIPYVCAAPGEYSTLAYFDPLQQPTIQNKVERSGKHKTKRVNKICRSSLDFHSANVSKGSINLGILGKNLLYYIRNPDRRYQPFFWCRCRETIAIMGSLLETLFLV